MTQMFVGLGNTPFLMVLGQPDNSSPLPDMSKVKAFIIPPGTGTFPATLLHFCTTKKKKPIASSYQFC